MTIREYQVSGELPHNYRAVFEQNLKRFAFRPPEPKRGEKRTAGWANPRRLLDPELTFRTLMIGDYLYFALRVDRIPINPQIFKARLSERIIARLKEKDRGKLPRGERDEIAQKLLVEMLSETAPTTAVYEVVWQLEGGKIYFTSSSDKLNEEFSGLFEECFEMTLTPQYPYFRAKDWAESEGLDSALETLDEGSGFIKW